MFLLEKRYHYTGSPEISDDMFVSLIRHVFSQYVFQADPEGRVPSGKPDSILYMTTKTIRVNGAHIHIRTLLFDTEEDAEATTRNYLLHSIDEELQMLYSVVGIRLEIKKEIV